MHDKFIEIHNFEERLRVEEKNDAIPLENIIYEYFRCYLIHEGDDRKNLSYEIIIDYNNFNRRILQDRVNLKLTFNDGLPQYIFTIINNESPKRS